MSQRPTSDPRRVALLVVLLGILAAVIVLRVRPALLQGVSSEGAAMVKVGSYTVPKLSWEGGVERKLTSPSSERNLFTYGPPPTPTPDMRPTPTPRPTLPPRPIATVSPDLDESRHRTPPPPRFQMDYLGWFGPDRLQVAVFREGAEILAVPKGETIKDKFILRGVGPLDVTIGYVGYPENVTTRVPISK